MLTIFEYLGLKSPATLWRLLAEYELNFFDYLPAQSRVVELMRHDHYRRVRGALRQMGDGVVIR